MQIIKFQNIQQPELKKIFQRSGEVYKSVISTVSEIITDVKENGDQSLRKYTKQFDQAIIENLQVSKEEIEYAYSQVSDDFLEAMRVAIENQMKFQKSIFKSNSEIIETKPGIKVWRESRPIQKVGLYIPGGRARYPSCLVMVGVPAKVAGCEELIVCTPPDEDGNLPYSIVVAADMVGVSKIFKVGGAQAIAAMAYGTESIPKVYKIFGAGNSFVTAAKMLVFGEVNIDMPAGPSEVMILADESAKPDWIAADLISQCEHGTESAGVLITTSEKFANRVKSSAYSQAGKLSSKEVITASLNNYGAAIIVKNWDEAITLVNEYAPEHLEIVTTNFLELKEKVINAGSVFLGNYSSEPAGDYASGSNHILPTNGFSKMFEGLSVDSFCKQVEFQELSKDGLQSIQKSINVLAQEEGLPAHANAINIRFNN